MDHELLVQETKEEVVLLQNGCVCCSVRADLTRVLKEQLARAGKPFDAIVVEIGHPNYMKLHDSNQL